MHPAVRKLRHRLLQIVAPHRLTWEENFRPPWAVSGYGRFEAGRRTYWRSDSKFTAWKTTDSITVGAYCSIASGAVLLAGGNHAVEALSTYPFSVIDRWADVEAERQPDQHLRVGNDVWIAAGAMVVGNITIGDGAVIAAGAVVVDDVPPYSVVAGVPARVVKARFSAEQVEMLLRLRWWEWPEPDILAAEPLLRAADVLALREFAERRGLVAAADPMSEVLSPVPQAIQELEPVL